MTWVDQDASGDFLPDDPSGEGHAGDDRVHQEQNQVQKQDQVQTGLKSTQVSIKGTQAQKANARKPTRKRKAAEVDGDEDGGLVARERVVRAPKKMELGDVNAFEFDAKMRKLIGAQLT